MTENINMNKEKEPKLVVQQNIDKDVNVTTRRRNLNMGRKQGYNVLQHRKKASFKQTMKQKNTTKLQKSPKKLPVSNKLLKSKEDICKHQIEQLNQILKQTYTCPTLTQEELKLLFMKYKLDGHYRTNMNLPPFTSLLNNTNNVIAANNYLYDKTKYTENNLSIHSNLNHTSTNCNIQTCSTENILADVHYKVQPESNLHANKISDMDKVHESFQHLNKDMIFNVQYENTEKNSLNSNIHNNCYLKDWNDNSTPSINKCSNFQSWENEHLDWVSQTNNMTLYYGTKNNLEDQSIFDSHIHRNVCPLTDNENLMYAADNNSINVQQNFNTYASNSCYMSDNFLLDPNTFLLPHTIID